MENVNVKLFASHSNATLPWTHELGCDCDFDFRYIGANRTAVT